MIKAICMDLDGSLLDSNKEISSATAKGLIDLSKQGIKIILASGRTKPRMYEYALQLGLDKSGGHIIESNGAAIYDFDSDQHEVIRRMEKHEVKHVFDCLKQEDVEILIMGEANCFIYLPPNQSESKYLTSGNMEGLKNRKFFEIQDPSEIDEEVNKVCVLETEEKVDELFHNLTLDKEQYWYGRTLPVWLEVGPKAVSKGNALQMVLDKHGIHPSEVIAFGDGENDLSMLKLVKYGIAMGNAMDSVKEACYDTCQSCDEDGIINYLTNMEVAK